MMEEDEAELEYSKIESEDQVVYRFNHHYHRQKPPKFVGDNINVFNLKGEQEGYQWNYGDAVCIDVNMENTTLTALEDFIKLSDLYLREGVVELEFIDGRGAVRYTFIEPASMITEFLFNTTEEKTIERNIYTLRATFESPNLYRRSLFDKEFSVLVR